MKRGGLMNVIKDLIYFVVVIGVLLAFLSYFNNDIGSAVTWVAQSILQAILSVAKFFTDMEIFRRLIG